MADILNVQPESKDEYGDSPALSDEQEDRLYALYEELGTALEIVLQCQTFLPGQYEQASWKDDWYGWRPVE
jgi:hypothetical protein